MSRHPDLSELFAEPGTIRKVADALHISVAAVSKWDTVPPARVHQVAGVLGVPWEQVPVAWPENVGDAA